MDLSSILCTSISCRKDHDDIDFSDDVFFGDDDNGNDDSDDHYDDYLLEAVDLSTKLPS